MAHCSITQKGGLRSRLSPFLLHQPLKMFPPSRQLWLSRSSAALSLRFPRQSGSEIRVKRIRTERASAGKMDDCPPFVAEGDLDQMVEVAG